MDFEAFGLSLRLATLTTALLVVFGIPVAYSLAISKWRYKFLVESLIGLPLVLPPTVLGFYLLNALGPRSPLGFYYEKLFGSPLPFSFGGILVGSVLYSLPFALQPFQAAFSSIDRRLIEASWSLGVSKSKTFLRITLPLSLPGIITGIVLSFAHTLGEFGVVLMLGGNIPGVTRTASISIYDDVQSLNYESAFKTSLALLGICFSILVFTNWIKKKGLQGWNYGG